MLNTILAIATLFLGFMTCNHIGKRTEIPLPEEPDACERQHTYLVNLIAFAKGDSELNYCEARIKEFHNRFVEEPGIIARVADLHLGLKEKRVNEIIEESMMSEC